MPYRYLLWYLKIMDFERENSQNSAFWDEACGTTFAIENKIDISDPSGIREFDEKYFDFYPYLIEELEWILSDSKSVIEVGIGVGSVSRYLAKRVDSYVGMDVAKSPCAFVDSSLRDQGLSGIVMNSSILDPCASHLVGTFDAAVSIGCLHHTGDLTRAITNLEHYVKPGGKVLIMVYYCFMPKRVVLHPLRCIKEVIKTAILSGEKIVFDEQDYRMRKSNDRNTSGAGAPITAYTSKKYFHERRSVLYKARLRNSHQLRFFGLTVSRKFLLKFISPGLGVNVYARGIKPK
jgi:SAM-dependent methyltransferase